MAPPRGVRNARNRGYGPSARYFKVSISRYPEVLNIFGSQNSKVWYAAIPRIPGLDALEYSGTPSTLKDSMFHALWDIQEFSQSILQVLWSIQCLRRSVFLQYAGTSEYPVDQSI